MSTPASIAQASVNARVCVCVSAWSFDSDADVSPVVEYFPLIVVPVTLNWFARREAALAKREAAGSDILASERPPHVIILGLAFLSKLRLTIDADEGRLSAVEPTLV